MQLIISKNLKKDITRIYRYILKDSIKYAIEMVDNMYSYIDKLKESPYMGRIVPELMDKRYREVIYKSYRIFYEISEETDTIYIHFIIHTRRDFKSFYNKYIKNK